MAALFSTRNPNHEISPTTPTALGPRQTRRGMPPMWGTRLVWVLGAADIRDTWYGPYVPGRLIYEPCRTEKSPERPLSGCFLLISPVSNYSAEKLTDEPGRTDVIL